MSGLGGEQPVPATESDPLGGEALADRIAAICSDRKAIDLTIVDLRGMVGYTDFFVVCTGNTDRQTRAIHDAVYRALKDDEGMLPARSEGVSEGSWILLDYLDCVLHVFTPDAREFYRLDRLWGEAPSRRVE